MIDDLDVDGPEVAGFLAELSALPAACDPTPSGDLVALLEAGLPGPLAPARVPRRQVAGVSAAVLLAALTGTGWAAAANELPRPVQDAIADLTGPLPFDVPHSSERDTPGSPTEWHGLLVDRPTHSHRSRMPAPEADAVDAHDTAPTGAGPERTHDTVPDLAPIAPAGDSYDDGPDEDDSQTDVGQPGGGPSDDGGGDAGDDQAGDHDAGDQAGAVPPETGPPGGGPPGGGPPAAGPPAAGPPGAGPPETGPPETGRPGTAPTRPPVVTGPPTTTRTASATTPGQDD